MKMNQTLLLIPVLFLLMGRHAAGQSSTDELWAQAEALVQQERYAEAIEIYDIILAQIPDSQRAAVERASAMIDSDTGQESQAVDDLEVAVARSPFSTWAAKGLLYQAKGCREAGCPEVAQEAIARLKGQFPDSAWTTHAELIEAELNDQPTDGLEAALSLDVQAYDLFRSYRAQFPVSPDRDDTGALAALDTIITTFPETRTALLAMRSEAYVFSQIDGRTADARQAFESLLAQLEPVYPQCETVFMLRKSLGALYQREDLPELAMAEFQALAEHATDPAIVNDALLQAIGAHNEALQRRAMLGDKPSADEWVALRDECTEFVLVESATPLQKSRADLILAESFHWQGKVDAALAAAEAHIALYDAATDRSGSATARLIAGECLQRRRFHEEALAHYQWIVDEFGTEEIWPGLSEMHPHRPHFAADLARTHYRICDALLRSGAPPEESAAACQHVLDNYPDTRYAELIQIGWPGYEP